MRNREWGTGVGRNISVEHQVGASSCASSVCTATTTVSSVLKRLGRREGQQAKTDKELCSRFVAWEMTRVPSEACKSLARDFWLSGCLPSCRPWHQWPMRLSGSWAELRNPAWIHNSPQVALVWGCGCSAMVGSTNCCWLLGWRLDTRLWTPDRQLSRQPLYPSTPPPGVVRRSRTRNPASIARQPSFGAARASTRPPPIIWDIFAHPAHHSSTKRPLVPTPPSASIPSRLPSRQPSQLQAGAISTPLSAGHHHRSMPG